MDNNKRLRALQNTTQLLAVVVLTIGLIRRAYIVYMQYVSMGFNPIFSIMPHMAGVYIAVVLLLVALFLSNKPTSISYIVPLVLAICTFLTGGYWIISHSAMPVTVEILLFVKALLYLGWIPIIISNRLSSVWKAFYVIPLIAICVLVSFAFYSKFNGMSVNPINAFGVSYLDNVQLGLEKNVITSLGLVILYFSTDKDVQYLQSLKERLTHSFKKAEVPVVVYNQQTQQFVYQRQIKNNSPIVKLLTILSLVLTIVLYAIGVVLVVFNGWDGDREIVFMFVGVFGILTLLMVYSLVLVAKGYSRSKLIVYPIFIFIHQAGMAFGLTSILGGYGEGLFEMMAAVIVYWVYASLPTIALLIFHSLALLDSNISNKARIILTITAMLTGVGMSICLEVSEVYEYLFDSSLLYIFGGAFASVIIFLAYTSFGISYALMIKNAED